MTGSEFETLTIGFTLGFVARPLLLMLCERRDVAEAERAREAEGVALRTLAEQQHARARAAQRLVRRRPARDVLPPRYTSPEER